MSLRTNSELLSSTPAPVTSPQPSAGAPEGPLCIPSVLPASALLLKKRTRRALCLPFRHRTLWKAGCCSAHPPCCLLLLSPGATDVSLHSWLQTIFIRRQIFKHAAQAKAKHTSFMPQKNAQKESVYFSVSYSELSLYKCRVLLQRTQVQFLDSAGVAQNHL